MSSEDRWQTYSGSREVREVQLGIADRSAAGLRALRHAESVRSKSGEVDGFKIFGDGLLAEQSRAEIGRAGFLRRGEPKKRGTSHKYCEFGREASGFWPGRGRWRLRTNVRVRPFRDSYLSSQPRIHRGPIPSSSILLVVDSPTLPFHPPFHSPEASRSHS